MEEFVKKRKKDYAKEPGYTPQEHTAARPTLEMNGVWGGFQGEGTKTVLPKEAHAKITCRLVANQDPATITQLLVRHIEQQTFPGVRVHVHPLPGSARPYLVKSDHWGNQIAQAVLTELDGEPAYDIRSGGSIPVCEVFFRTLRVYTISFGLSDEQIHAPNEFFRLSSFHRGPVAYAKLLHRLRKQSFG